jgi:Cu-Zn family superoxide dismutase
MKKVYFISLILLAAFGAAIYTGMAKDGSEEVSVKESAEKKSVKVDMINKKGDKIGTAELTQVVEGVKINVEVSGLTPGKHGFHIHETGKCDPPDFKSAGEHFNPGGKEHGFLNPQGPHAGDLPNIEAGLDGKVKAEMINLKVTLEKGKPNSLLKEGGTALVIHEDPDDLKSNPSGNSGARVACGVIKQ